MPMTLRLDRSRLRYALTVSGVLRIAKIDAAAGVHAGLSRRPWISLAILGLLLRITTNTTSPAGELHTGGE